MGSPVASHVVTSLHEGTYEDSIELRQYEAIFLPNFNYWNLHCGLIT